MTKIYTKRGDTGQTQLADGQCCSKHSPHIAVLGKFDELTSALGWAKLTTDAENHAILEGLQKELIQIAGQIACAKKTSIAFDERIKWFEENIDEKIKHLPHQDNFTLPGENEAHARLHLARTIARALERELVGLSLERKHLIPSKVMIYFNRLSDWLYVLAESYNAMLDCFRL